MKRVTKPATEDVAWRQGSSPPLGSFYCTTTSSTAPGRGRVRMLPHGSRYRLPSTSSAIAVGVRIGPHRPAKP
jgi:hypothetical protein